MISSSVSHDECPSLLRHGVITMGRAAGCAAAQRCHCEKRSAEAISKRVRTSMEIAASLYPSQ